MKNIYYRLELYAQHNVVDECEVIIPESDADAFIRCVEAVNDELGELFGNIEADADSPQAVVIGYSESSL